MKTRVEILKKIQSVLAESKSPSNVLGELAQTEMFDISNYVKELPVVEKVCKDFIKFGKRATYVQCNIYSKLSLPFENTLVKINEREQTFKNMTFHLENHVFIHENSPEELTGFLVCTLEAYNRPDVDIQVVLEPIVINRSGLLMLFTKDDEPESERETGCRLITRALVTLDNLRECKVYDYTAHSFSPKYIRRKGCPTLKIDNRPIYYVMNKDDKETKPRNIDLSKGRLSCSYAFKVRGHWRTLHNPKTIGLDRNGQRTVLGSTWIKEYIKGEGDLIKRVRVIK